jgi:hypothetical protein
VQLARELLGLLDKRNKRFLSRILIVPQGALPALYLVLESSPFLGYTFGLGLVRETLPHK